MLTRFNDFDRTFAAMDQLRRRMDRLFDEYERPRGQGLLRSPFFDEPERTWSRDRLPRITVADSPSALTLRVELPGFAEKDVQISIHQDVLTLSGERKLDAPEGYVVHRQERAGFRFARSFAMPCKIDPEKSSAVLKNGLLTVSLAKAPEAQPRQIAVKVQ